MKQQRRTPRGLVITLAAIPLALSQAFAAQSTAIWTAASGNYATPGNWSTGLVPLNSAINTYIVQIGTGKTVAYTTTGAQAIDQLFLDTGSALNLSATSAFQRPDLTVLGQALMAGSINVDKGAFTALAAGTDFVGNATTVSATGGSVVKMAATAFNASGLANATTLNASGVGSLVNLSGVKSLDVGQSNGYDDFISATSGAKIKLSGLTSLVAPASNRSLIFTVSGGAHIDLSSLQSLSGVTVDSGRTVFNLDGASATIGPLQKANQLYVSLQNASTMTLGGYAGAANVTNSTFSVAGGAKLMASSLQGTLSEHGLPNITLLSTADSGSLLDLSGLRTLDVGQGSGYDNFITATTRAKINLSGLTTLVAPISTRALVVTANTGASINLASLQTISNGSGGQVNFNVASAGSLLVHGIQAGPGVNFNLAGAGSSLTVAGSLALLSGSTLTAGSGTRIDISGGFSFAQSVESQMNLDLATLGFSGGGAHLLEIGGRRTCMPAAAAPVLGNFGIGQRVVGQAHAAATSVRLVDAVNNGNRLGSTGEALNLNSDTDGNGLAILGGSTLLIGNLDVDTYQTGQWLHLNDLFKNGATRIAYDQGFVSLTPVPEPLTVSMLLAGLGLVAWRRRHCAA